jgi:hypothetical protein
VGEHGEHFVAGPEESRMTERPSSIMRDWMMRLSSSGSTLPPHSTTPGPV